VKHVREALDELRERGAKVRKWTGDERLAHVYDLAAALVEEAVAADANELLNLTEAAAASGFSARTLSRRIEAGELENYGRPNAPRVRRGDLPRKAKPQAERPRPTLMPDPAEEAGHLGGFGEVEEFVRVGIYGLLHQRGGELVDAGEAIVSGPAADLFGTLAELVQGLVNVLHATDSSAASRSCRRAASSAASRRTFAFETPRDAAHASRSRFSAGRTLVATTTVSGLPAIIPPGCRYRLPPHEYDTHKTDTPPKVNDTRSVSKVLIYGTPCSQNGLGWLRCSCDGAFPGEKVAKCSENG